jgi:hypothetical protein
MNKIILHKLLFLSLIIIFLIAVCLQPVRAQTGTPTSTGTPISPTRTSSSSWQTPVQLAQDVPQIDGLALAVDSQGRAHAVWSQGSDPNGPTTSLLYSRLDGQGATSMIQILQAPQGEMARQPSLLVDGQDTLHLIYSGGESGEIFYTRAEAALAGSAGGWLKPKVVSYATGAAWPQIGLAPDGQLYIVYVVPFNENRGVYWLRSADGGETWTTPALVFNAASAGWQGVGHVALAIGSDGSLQVVFEQASLPGEWPVQGLYYTVGSASSEALSFSKPDGIAPAGSRNPQLAVTGNLLHLVYDGQVGLESRRLDLSVQGSNWSGVEHLNGWQFGFGGEPAFGLAADAQNAHLASPLQDGSGLHYSAWLSATQNGWTNPPESIDFPQASLSTSLEATATAARSSAGNLAPADLAATATAIWSNGVTPAIASLVAAAAGLNGGSLAVAWVTQWGGGMQMFLVLRSIPKTTIPASPVIIPTSTQTPAPTQTVTPASGTPTPNLNIPMTGYSMPVNPMYLGGGLAALLVLLALGGYLLLNNRRR